eukprot:1863556-Rhodomonas_salina.1
MSTTPLASMLIDGEGCWPSRLTRTRLPLCCVQEATLAKGPDAAIGSATLSGVCVPNSPEMVTRVPMGSRARDLRETVSVLFTSALGSLWDMNFSNQSATNIGRWLPNGVSMSIGKMREPCVSMRISWGSWPYGTFWTVKLKPCKTSRTMSFCTDKMRDPELLFQPAEDSKNELLTLTAWEMSIVPEGVAVSNKPETVHFDPFHIVAVGCSDTEIVFMAAADAVLCSMLLTLNSRTCRGAASKAPFVITTGTELMFDVSSTVMFGDLCPCIGFRTVRLNTISCPGGTESTTVRTTASASHHPCGIEWLSPRQTSYHNVLRLSCPQTDIGHEPNHKLVLRALGGSALRNRFRQETCYEKWGKVPGGLIHWFIKRDHVLPASTVPTTGMMREFRSDTQTAGPSSAPEVSSTCTLAFETTAPCNPDRMRVAGGYNDA